MQAYWLRVLPASSRRRSGLALFISVSDRRNAPCKRHAYNHGDCLVVARDEAGDIPVEQPTKFDLVVNLTTLTRFRWPAPLSYASNKLSPQSAENEINNDAKDKHTRENSHKNTIGSSCADEHFRAAGFRTYGVHEQCLSPVSGAKIVPIG